MNRFLRLVAIVLLAVWLPATTHCMIEASGILDVHSESADTSGCCVDPQPCADDSCEIVEQGLTASSTASVKVPQAQLLAAVHFLCVPTAVDCEVTARSAQLGGLLERPPDWVPAWHFEHRTAHPPRAPSIVSA